MDELRKSLRLKEQEEYDIIRYYLSLFPDVDELDRIEREERIRPELMPPRAQKGR